MYYRRTFLMLVVAVTTVFTACAQENSLLGKARKMLAEGTSVSRILQDPQFDSIRPESDFRQLIRDHTTNGTLTIVTEKEPGTKITVKGMLTDGQHHALSGKLVYVYQTDTRGWYASDRPHILMNEGDRNHARLFGYVKTDASGNFELYTIQPHGYPHSDLPAHIHLEVFDSDNHPEKITELLFDDDERLKGEIRSRSEKEGFYIARPVVEQNKKTFHYTIIVDGH